MSAPSSWTRSRPSATRFAARVARGRIREGHGDLRLEHVYFLPRPRRRRRDRLHRVQRTVPLWRRGGRGGLPGHGAGGGAAPRSGRRFLARFAEASDDFGLYGVVDFYLSYRAWVRGKVAAFLAADATRGRRAPVRGKRDEAGAASRSPRPSPACPSTTRSSSSSGGVIGSGKSTLAAALGRELAAPVVSSDRTRKAMAGLAPTARGGAELYTPEAVDRNYREVLRRGGEVLASRRGVILDATFSTRRWRQRPPTWRAARARASCSSRRAAPIARCCARGWRRAGARPSVSDATDAELDELLALRAARPGDPGPRAVDRHRSEPAAVASSPRWPTLRGLGILPAPRAAWRS